MEQAKPVKAVALGTLLPIMEEAFANGQTVILPVTGVSMRPTLLPGDSVTLAPVGEIRRGDVLLYRRKSGQFVLHRVVSVHADTVDFCGDGQVEVEKGVSKCAVIAGAIGCTHEGNDRSADYLKQTGKKRLRSRPFRRLMTALHHLRCVK